MPNHTTPAQFKPWHLHRRTTGFVLDELKQYYGRLPTVEKRRITGLHVYEHYSRVLLALYRIVLFQGILFCEQKAAWDDLQQEVMKVKAHVGETIWLSRESYHYETLLWHWFEQVLCRLMRATSNKKGVTSFDKLVSTLRMEMVFSHSVWQVAVSTTQSRTAFLLSLSEDRLSDLLTSRVDDHCQLLAAPNLDDSQETSCSVCHR